MTASHTDSDRSAQKSRPTAVFWGEISPCEHLVQIYLDDAVFLDSLEEFIAEGLKADDGVIVIATPSHRSILESRLISLGLDMSSAVGRDQYIALDASETLSAFIITNEDGQALPDESRFRDLVNGLVARARGKSASGRRVRAFGEMVAILWAQGCIAATVRLEQIWHNLCEENGFSLVCAYPKTGFTQDADASIKEICAAHSRVISA